MQEGRLARRGPFHLLDWCKWRKLSASFLDLVLAALARTMVGGEGENLAAASYRNRDLLDVADPGTTQCCVSGRWQRNRFQFA